jgi:hypothetical protein
MTASPTTSRFKETTMPRIYVTEQGKYGGDTLTVGVWYSAEPSDEGTLAQNKAFHALCQEYYYSGCHSYPAASFKEFRNYIKKNLGAGFESYVYIMQTPDGFVWTETSLYKDISRNVAKDKDGKPLIKGKLKSWADYTKKERKETIDRLVSEMHQAGVQTKKFYEILDGMEQASNKRMAI